MVKKIILLIDKESVNNIPTINESLELNKKLYTVVNKHKNKITYYHNNRQWDKFKKLSNEYESIFTSPNIGSNISLYNPVSRSFFKLWEIIHDFKKEISLSQTNIKCLFLAEGPGGFAEAVIKYRLDNKYTKDKFYGISLKSGTDKNIPEWKLQKDCMKKVEISYGHDGTGNLYNFNNIEHLNTTLGAHSIDFITADGGFDFSSDFNGQEELSFHLILCEVVCALLLQKNGGTFILKIFDMFTENTLKLLQILTQYYKKIHLIKPLTSRPANSEKYVLCTGFEEQQDEILNSLKTLLKNYSDKKITDFFKEKIKYDPNIVSKLINYNNYYVIRQVMYIEQTISYIDRFSNKTNDVEMNKIMKNHIRKSQKWCDKYGIESSIPSLEG